VLIATDADWVLAEIRAALEGPGTSFTLCRNGRQVAGAVAARPPDVAVLDLQVGSMGGMAVTMALRLDESAGALPHVPVVMLLDRVADVHLARRSGAEAWLVKPLDALRLRAAVSAAMAGEEYHEGVPATAAAPADEAERADEAESPDGEPAPTG